MYLIFEKRDGPIVFCESTLHTALIRVPFSLDHNLRIAVEVFDKFAGIMPITKLGCIVVNTAFGFFASDGTTIVSDSTKSGEVFHLVNHYWPALDKSGYKFVLKSGNATYTLPNQAFRELAEEGLSCLLDTKYVEETDGDYYKHLLNHIRFMLL